MHTRVTVVLNKLVFALEVFPFLLPKEVKFRALDGTFIFEILQGHTLSVFFLRALICRTLIIVALCNKVVLVALCNKIVKIL